jgi:hypothetical protein
VEWKRNHNEELYSLYRSPNLVRVIKSRQLRWAIMQEDSSYFEILTENLTGNRPLGRSRRRWDGNTGIQVKEIGVDRGDG